MPAVAMHSAVSGTSPLEGFLGLGEGRDTRKPYSGSSWGQLGLGGRGLCLGDRGLGRGIGDKGDPAGGEGGTWASLGLTLSCAHCQQLTAPNGWAPGSGSFSQAGHGPEEWGPGPGSSGRIRGLSFHCGFGPGSQKAPSSTS